MDREVQGTSGPDGVLDFVCERLRWRRRWRYSVRAPCCEQTSGSFVVGPDEVAVDLGVVVLEPTPAVVGLVVAAGGARVVDGKVRLASVRREAAIDVDSERAFGGSLRMTAETAETAWELPSDGSFTIEGAFSPDSVLVFSARDHLYEVRRLPAESVVPGEVYDLGTIELVRGVPEQWIRGRVISRSGERLAGAQIVIVGCDGRSLPRVGDDTRRVESLPTGEFAIRAVLDRQHDLLVSHERLGPWELLLQRVVPGSGEFVVSPGSGQPRAPDGSGGVGLDVYVLRRRERWSKGAVVAESYPGREAMDVEQLGPGHARVTVPAGTTKFDVVVGKDRRRVEMTRATVLQRTIVVDLDASAK